MDVPPLESGCPWSTLSELARPDIKWCEAPRCSWIVEPANTWSNLFFLGVAAVLWHWSRKRTASDPLRWFAPSALLVGAFSFLYHASYTFFFQVFDFVGMFLVLGLALGINLERLQVARAASVVPAVALAGVALLALLRWQGINIQPIVGLLLLTVVLSEVACHQRLSGRVRYGRYVTALALLAFAAVFSFLDVTRTLCRPDNHWLQGHALWHLFAALSMLPLYRFYESARG